MYMNVVNQNDFDDLKKSIQRLSLSDTGALIINVPGTKSEISANIYADILQKMTREDKPNFIFLLKRVDPEKVNTESYVNKFNELNNFNSSNKTDTWSACVSMTSVTICILFTLAIFYLIRK